MDRFHAALAAPLLGLAAVMVLWLSIDRRPREWDHANHPERAVACHRSLSEPGRDGLADIIAESSFYPRPACSTSRCPSFRSPRRR